MSNIYIQEPPTEGKVLLVTSVGDIDVELWCKETPRACRNFIQLCMEGYYDDTVFHRVVPGFIAQGGDPTASGHGGESIYGKTFKDEFHSRLRFNRRGLLGMANAGPHDNGSQFFFTLGEAPELNNKHTLFGKVTGSTVYNMVKLQEGEIGQDDRPVYPQQIIRVKILSNPFEDIIPRIVKRKDKDDDKKKKKSKSKATKNFSLLSFGDEAEEDEVETNKVTSDFRHKGKSSHDLLEDDRLSALPAVESETSRKRSLDDEESSDDDSDESSNDERTAKKHRKKEAMMDQIRKKLTKDQPDPDKPPGEIEDGGKSTKLADLKREAKRLKRELAGLPEKSKETPQDTEDAPPEPEDNDMVAAFKAERQKYKTLKKQQNKDKSRREQQTLAMLAKFQTKLDTAQQMAEYGEEDKPSDEQEEGEEEEEDDTDFSWMSHKLQFENEEIKRKVIDANIQELDRYEIFDPRNPLNQRRREASKQAMKDKR